MKKVRPLLAEIYVDDFEDQLIVLKKMDKCSDI